MTPISRMAPQEVIKNVLLLIVSEDSRFLTDGQHILIAQRSMNCARLCIVRDGGLLTFFKYPYKKLKLI